VSWATLHEDGSVRGEEVGIRMGSRQESRGVVLRGTLSVHALLKVVPHTGAVPQADGRDDVRKRSGGFAIGRARQIGRSEDAGPAGVRLSTSAFPASSKRCDRVLRQPEILWGRWIGDY